MSDFLNSIDVMGDEVVACSIIDKTIIEFKDNEVTVVGAWAFENCSQLTIVDLPSVTNIKMRAFQRCSSLKAFILRNTEIVCTLENTNGFYNSAVSQGICKIYVPASLLATYTNATNWASYKSIIRVLEDYTVDGTTTGELDLSKI